MNPTDVIRKALSHVEIEDIIIEYDPLADGDVANVIINEDQLEAALGDGGANARRAAMESGMNVEIVLIHEWRARHVKPGAPAPDATPESD
jgi:transcription antitermination factor NusA-like protein